MENCASGPCLHQSCLSGFMDVEATEQVSGMKTEQWPASRPPGPLPSSPAPALHQACPEAFHLSVMTLSLGGRSLTPLYPQGPDR